jgi:hypothetical protein
MSEEKVPCVPGLFSEEGGVARVHGSRCAGCGTPYFPRSAACHNPDCTDSRMEDCSFGGAGKLWSFSVADFPPPPPHKFDKPFKSLCDRRGRSRLRAAHGRPDGRPPANVTVGARSNS